MVTAANRGKVAEALARDAFAKLANSQTTYLYRFPDMRAGSMAPAIADFMLLHQGKTYLVEVKETQHEFRLPHKNFETAQVARMRMAQMAGAKCVVLVYHATLKMWRGFNVEQFTEREGGSWDLRSTELSSLEDIIKSYD